MRIKEVGAKSILDSRGEKTIFVSVKTNAGEFGASAPSGKSRGKNEKSPWKKDVQGDIKTIKEFSDYFSEEVFERFEDLRRAEDILEGHVGANTVFAFESAVLKAMAREQEKQVWELINPDARDFPRLVGNCIGGGKHSSSERKPDFQEFLLIPNSNSIVTAQNTNKDAKVDAEIILKNVDAKFKGKKTDEDAWMTSLNDKSVLEVLKDLKDNIFDSRKIYLDEGLDIAASSFYKRKKYSYENPKLKRNEEEQFSYVCNLIKNFNLLYIEDPFHEEDFESFAKLLKKFPDRLIVGDDLITTNLKRLEKAIKMKSVNAIIVKPNQIGSLIEVKEVCELSKKNDIKLVFSHRSGETEENILADLAFGFQAEFLKCGITSKVREAKMDRLVEIGKEVEKGKMK